MNIVDLISSQLSGDVLGKLGGLAGANEAQTRTAADAAVPALLNVFAKLASSNNGADQLAKAMGGLDLSMLGNLAGMLGGGQASGLGTIGGNLLGSLLGGSGNMSGIVDAIAKFAGIQPGIMKTLLTYLAPIVLGTIAKQFTGRPDAAGVSRLFAEQATNISGALPKGLSLGDVAQAAVSAASRAAAPAGSHGGHEAAQSGFPGWLLPLLLLGALIAGYYVFNENNKAKQGKEAKEGEALVLDTVKKDGPVTDERTEVIVREGKKISDVVTETISIDPKFLEAGKVAGSLFTGLTKVLSGIKDAETAKAALPELNKFAPLLKTLESETEKLPADEKPAFAKVIAENLGLLQKVVDTALAIPGVKELLGPVVAPMVEALAKLGGK